MPAYNGEMEDVLRPFLDAMRYKLASNKHRGKRNWQDLPITDLLRMLKNEVTELEEAIKSGNQVEILLEAADVGNFSMMVANVAIALAAGGNGSDQNLKIDIKIPKPLSIKKKRK